MASYMRSVICRQSPVRAVLLPTGTAFPVECKRYIRGLRRTPVRVIFPGEEAEKRPASARREEAPAGLRAAGCSGTRDPARTGTSRQSPAGELRFEKALPGDKRLARMVSVARSRTFRERQGKILLEGRRLICDALSAGASPRMVFFSAVERLKELPLDGLRRATLVKVRAEDLKLWSDLVAPQGVIAIFSRPEPSRLNFGDSAHSVPLTLICDNIRDPGNLGTVLRGAAAAGCQRVLLTKGCADVWEPKVLRAAMGAHFRLPIYSGLSWDSVESHLPKPVTVCVGDSCGGRDARRGTEDPGDGSSPVHRGRPGDYGWVGTKPKQGRRREESDSDSDSDSDDAEGGLSLPRVDVQLYHESWARSPTALVVGGETLGLSVEAVRLAEKTAGRRLFIPIVPSVDSLNSAMAASILLLEARKQLLDATRTSGMKRRSKAPSPSLACPL